MPRNESFNIVDDTLMAYSRTPELGGWSGARKPAARTVLKILSIGSSSLGD